MCKSHLLVVNMDVARALQNADLVQEARTTRSLRDELDILKEKVREQV